MIALSSSPELGSSPPIFFIYEPDSESAEKPDTRLNKAYANKALYSTPDMFSPPSERKPHVLRLELTQGCDYNACTFCDGYNGVPYRARTYEEFLEHFENVESALSSYIDEKIRRVFLGGGNALSVDTETLSNTVRFLENRIHPKRISIYGRADAILMKGDGLLKLRDAGLSLIFMGVESGSDTVLRYVNKGTTLDEMLKAVEIADKSGIDLSVTIMPGLGGIKYYDEHVEGTVAFMDSAWTKYITLMGINPGISTRYAGIMEREQREGTNRPLTDAELVMQVRDIIQSANPRHQRIGMFGPENVFRHEVDRVSHNPIQFNASFFSHYEDLGNGHHVTGGKEMILHDCDFYLKHKATD